MNILIHSKKNTLHHKTYKTAFKGLVKNGFKVYYSHEEGNKENIYKEVLKHANRIKCDCIIFNSLEDILDLNFIKSSFNLKKKNIQIYAIYFHYYHLNKISIKSILLTLLLIISPLKKIYISDPNFLSSKLQKLLSRKLFFLPDVFSIEEKPKIFSKNNFQKKLGLTKESILISALGRLDNKKSIEVLLISLSEISNYLKKNNVKVYLAGLIDENILKRNIKSIKILKKDQVLIISNKFLSNKDFYTALQYSNAIWCVQDKFFGSSGVFTRTLSMGNIPIVNRVSSIGSICLKENFGFSITLKEDIAEQIKNLIGFLKNRKEIISSKEIALKWSKKSSQEKFIEFFLESLD